MTIKSLSLINFKNYKKAEFRFDKFNVIVGNNASGKTNLLEAINFLSNGMSFRPRNQKDLINKNAITARMEALVLVKGRQFIIDSFLEIKDEKTIEKKLRINKKIRKMSDFIGTLKTVSFLPSNITLVDDPPSEKRSFFDSLIMQIEGTYYQEIAYFDKVVANRNKLLEKISNNKAKENELDFWDEEMVKFGISIAERRKKVIDFMNKLVSKIYKKLTSTENDLEIEYRVFLPRLMKLKKEERVKYYQTELGKIRKKEIYQACSLLGPHRDDFVFKINKKNLVSFGSRSEFREAILTLKIAGGKLIEKVVCEKPVFLLDDVVSELDKHNKDYLFRFLSDYILDSQIFITTTSLDEINKDFLAKAKIFHIKQGKVCL